MLTGGAIVVLVSPYFDGTALPMIVAIALCALVAMLLVVLVMRRQTPVVAG